MNYDSDPVISKRVYETYPVTKKEKKCALHRAKMEAKRFELAKRLIDEKGVGIESSESLKELCDKLGVPNEIIDDKDNKTFHFRQ